MAYVKGIVLSSCLFVVFDCLDVRYCDVHENIGSFTTNFETI